MSYAFRYTDDSPYGHIVHLLDQHLPDRGLIIDLGCGHAAIAEPTLKLGFSYAGVDGDAATVDELNANSPVDAFVLDLNDLDRLAERLDEIAAGRPIAAVTAIDVLEHLPRPDDTLRTLHVWMLERDVAALAVSIPNVGHVDLAAKLVTGRWDVTPTGLLDETHLRFFTDDSVRALMETTGFDEIARHDFRLIFSDQAWPPDHPTQSPESMLGRYLRTLRELSDDHAETNQFVRIYSPAPTPMSTPRGGAVRSSSFATEPVTERRTPFLSIVTRTMGHRHTLVDTLACLAAQTDDDFEVLLMVNTDDDDASAAVADLVASFDDRFRSQVRIDVSTVMHRVAPLNRALDLAAGRYLTVLDDDDLVFGDWVEQFHSAANAHPGAVIRCRAVDQQIDTVGHHGPAVSASGFKAPYRATFDLASHLAGGQSPQGTMAVPCEALDTFRLRFDENMVVCEDLEFYLRVANICGVVDTGTFGMVYRRWTDRFASQHTVSPEVWEQSIQEIVRRLDAMPLLMPTGTASRLYQAAVQERQLYELDQGTSALLRRADVAERNWASLADAYAQLEHEFRKLADDRNHWVGQAEQLAPARWASLLRRVVRRCRHLLSGGS